MVSSRDEGGPMALIESMSLGVPVVSTPVGMSVDLLSDNFPFLLSKSTNPADLSTTALKFLKTKKFWVSAFDASAKKNFTKNDWRGKNVLLFGSEGFGLKNKTLEHSDFIFKIDILFTTILIIIIFNIDIFVQ